MDHKGVPYTIRQGIERHQWTVIIYLPGGLQDRGKAHPWRPCRSSGSRHHRHR